MEIEVAAATPAAVETDVLAVAITDPFELTGAVAELDAALGRRLAALAAEDELPGGRGSATLLHVRDEIAAKRVVVVGLGKRSELDADAVRTAAAKAAEKAGGRSLAWVAEDGLLSPAELGRAVADGVVLGPHDPGRWKTDGERRKPVERLVLCGPAAAAAADEARRAALVAGWANRCRELVETPANELTPTRLADFAGELESRFEHVATEVLDEDGILALGMNAFAAVARGSAQPPRLLAVRHEPSDPARPELVLGLVGKAITFDSGGISIKPSARMSDMKTDMGGGAAVLAAVGAIAELGIPVRIVAVVAACENMLDGDAYRPGDIVRAANGKTIEVTNTDAEGRLVLADALWYAREQGATHVVDIATLTGGVVVALGDFYAGLFANDDAWLGKVRAAAEATGDHAWPLPLHDTYRRLIRSAYADMTNSSEIRQATPLYAAVFLEEFAGEGPWAHLDIAGTGQLDRGRDDYYAGEGATGFGVRLFAELARRLT